MPQRTHQYDLPDGLVAFVKKDCPTCELVAPLLSSLAEGDTPFTVYTQDDPQFPAAAPWVVDDTELAFSWHHDVETVPTLVFVEDGQEAKRIVGWLADEWREFTGMNELGEGLPDYRPGCGSLSVDPNLSDQLEVKYGDRILTSRVIEFAAQEDEFEAMYDRGWSDGLPLVPPTELRVSRMLEGTSLEPSHVVTLAPPNLVELTVEKIAINAVMAGCRPEYLPVVIAGLDAICTDEFNIHGVLATTMAVGPVFVVNGPIRDEIGMNSGINVLGHGNRANSTIGRAIQLAIRNVGGGAPGGIDRSTQGNPGKLGFCFAEDEDGSPWESLAVRRGVSGGTSAITAFCGEGPRIVVDQLSRTPESLTKMLAQALLATNSPRTVMGMDAMLVLSPEHMSRFTDAGWSHDQFREALFAELTIEADTILRGADGIAEGLPAFAAGRMVTKFDPADRLHIVHAGGPAGLFSSVIGGWLKGPNGSVPVTKEILR